MWALGSRRRSSYLSPPLHNACGTRPTPLRWMRPQQQPCRREGRPAVRSCRTECIYRMPFRSETRGICRPAHWALRRTSRAVTPARRPCRTKPRTPTCQQPLWRHPQTPLSTRHRLRRRGVESIGTRHRRHCDCASPGTHPSRSGRHRRGACTSQCSRRRPASPSCTRSAPGEPPPRFAFDFVTMRCLHEWHWRPRRCNPPSSSSVVHGLLGPRGLVGARIP